MLNSELALLSKSFPKELREYDAHIYYDVYRRYEALELLDKAIESFQGKTVFVGRMIEHPIGPHPVPMFEINFSRDLLEEMIQWFLLYRGNLTVLIHEVTGDDERDHSDGALWLGTPLLLDVSKFSPRSNLQI